MPQLISAQGVFDELLMFLDGTEDDVDTEVYVKSLQAFGTHPAGMGVRILVPDLTLTEDNTITFSIHGSLTEDGAAVSGTTVFSKTITDVELAALVTVETFLPFVLPSEVGWIVFTITQATGEEDDLSGIIAGIVTDLGYKAGDWTRADPWDITKDIPAPPN